MRTSQNTFPSGQHHASPYATGITECYGLTIGLVNIMPADARCKTRQQYNRVLKHNEHHITLKYFALAEGLENLWHSRLDGLIITGMEPQQAAMEDELIWPEMAKLIDWAGMNTISTIFSCFSAHAAVYYLDGICRQRLDKKISGVFECIKSAQHPLLFTSPAQWSVPHSRYNTLTAQELAGSGYTILSHGADTGVDMFTKKSAGSLFLFLQGHPEYGAEILLSEYCRDIRRFIAGERQIYPALPEGYFNPDMARKFIALKQKTPDHLKLARLKQLQKSAAVTLTHNWQSAADSLYAGWLNYIAAQKTTQLASVR